MRNDVVMIVAIIASAVVAVKYFDSRQYARDHEDPAAAPNIAASVKAKSTVDRWSDEVRIPAARDQQFYIDLDVNRRSAHFLIDTGASYVALRESIARDAGIYTQWNDFTYSVQTANGETKAAFVTIDEMEIQGIRVDDVKAFILKDDQLSTNLLGMSFLSRIESVEARSGEMILRG